MLRKDDLDRDKHRGDFVLGIAKLEADTGLKLDAAALRQQQFIIQQIDRANDRQETAAQ